MYAEINNYPLLNGLHVFRQFTLEVLTLEALNQIIRIFTLLQLCLATTTHNFKWVKITHICLIWDQRFANIDV